MKKKNFNVGATIVIVALTAIVLAACKQAPKIEYEYDVYVAGYEFKGSKEMAKYWKNGEAVTLTNGSKGARTETIFVSGNDVYTAGFEGSMAKYWKNKKAVALTDGSENAGANGIYVVKREVVK